MSLTYQTGQFAGDPHGREDRLRPLAIQYAPTAAATIQAWKFLMDRDHFLRRFRSPRSNGNDPLFVLQRPAAGGAANHGPMRRHKRSRRWQICSRTTQQVVRQPADYVKLAAHFAASHRKDGKPYLAEAAAPRHRLFEGHDSYNHSEHYFHSTFNDLVITGLVGLERRMTTR